MPLAMQSYASAGLAKKLFERISRAGPISVHDYMEACLYDPEYGYYRTKAGIGQGGDFITAPEISQVFGELIGLWVGEVWRQMGAPRPVRLVELGPGRGTLMADALRALKVALGFLEAATVHLVETSKALRDVQRVSLSGAPIFWHDEMRDVPEGASIAIANEVFDCLPVRQFVFDGDAGRWRERMVGLEGDALRFAAGPFADLPGGLEAGGGGAEADAILEHRPGVSRLLDVFAARSPFAALIVDYGYAKPSFGDTVQAVKAHRFTSPFDTPGESDLTAHVDFCALKQAAKDAGLAAFGPMPMGEWLLRLGLEARVAQLLARATDKDAADLRSRIARLVDPAQMGALFKVLALTHGVPSAPPPF